MEKAWADFINILSKGLYIRSRVDLAENFLLMIPAGFFGMGLVWPAEKKGGFLFAFIPLIFCFFSSLCIEFSQIFFLGRTPSVSDILMQSLGSLAGVVAWWLWGHKIWRRYFSHPNYGKPIGLSEKILWLYLIILFAYNLIPLDLTINPFGIYRKLKAGRIILIPFTYSYSHVGVLLYNLVTDAVIWMPAGFLWVLTKGKKPFEAWSWTLLSVTAIEVAQLFISSRIFDITDIIMGAAGGGIGVLLCLKIRYFDQWLPIHQKESKREYKLVWMGIGLFCFYFLLLFWFPYEFKIQRHFVENQLNRFFQVPFYVYYYSGGLNAITAVFQKSLFFAPLGVCLAIAGLPLRKFGVNSLLALVSLILFAGAGLIVELGQALLPNKIPDTTDLIFETIGGGMGYWLTLKIYKRTDGFNFLKPKNNQE